MSLPDIGMVVLLCASCGVIAPSDTVLSEPRMSGQEEKQWYCGGDC